MIGMSSPGKPLGWRKRIGVLSPTVIETAAYDFYRLAPEGVSMCAITANVEHWSKENFKQSVLDPQVEAGTSDTLISEAAIRAMYKHWRREMGV